jgi:hypothetical protein
VQRVRELDALGERATALLERYGTHETICAWHAVSPLTVPSQRRFLPQEAPGQQMSLTQSLPELRSEFLQRFILWWSLATAGDR